MKKALLPRVIGQDGPGFTKLLRSNGYEMRRGMQRPSHFNTNSLADTYNDPHVLGLHFRVRFWGSAGQFEPSSHTGSGEAG
jgi:GDP-D-mannose dehydratase